METKNFLYWLERIKFFFLFVLAIYFLTACESLQRRQGRSTTEGVTSSEKTNPGTTVGAKNNTEDGEENPDASVDLVHPDHQQEGTSSRRELPRVGVVLGPGGLKALAHTGVIKELLKANINIDAMVGLEWGSLVAALYAQKKQIHDVEWKLYKLKSKDFSSKGGFSKFLTKSAQPILLKKVKPFLSKNIEARKIEDLNFVYACPSMSLWSGTVIWQDRGLLSKSVERCWPYPPLFQPQSPWMAASFAVEESIQYLKNKGMEIIIFVNVLGKGQLLKQSELMKNYTSAILWHQLKRHMESVAGSISSSKNSSSVEVVHVQTRSYKLYDFKHRQALVKAGEQAGREAADRIALKYGF